jgi:Mrp family chromosome partitioning ATPase
MGRMIDILRNADRRPNGDTHLAEEPLELAEAEETAAIPITASDPVEEPPLVDDDTVPFIEVGGPRELGLRIVGGNDLSPSATEPPANPGRQAGHVARTHGLTAGIRPDMGRPVPMGSSAPAPALFTIRFQPIHAARLGSRGPLPELIAFHQPEHPISVQYRSLAAEIDRQLPGELPRVLLLTGAADGVGTSTVLLNLAITLARQDSTVTVVDAHVGRPALAERLGLPGGPGLREVLAGQMPPAWCVQETAHPKLMVLPAGVAGQPRAGAVVSPILEALRERNDCVLIDAGPWGEVIAADLAGISDAVYLVLRQDAMATAETALMQDEILQRTGRLRGCVITSRDT